MRHLGHDVDKDVASKKPIYGLGIVYRAGFITAVDIIFSFLISSGIPAANLRLSNPSSDQPDKQIKLKLNADLGTNM